MSASDLADALLRIAAKKKPAKKKPAKKKPAKKKPAKKKPAKKKPAKKKKYQRDVENAFAAVQDYLDTTAGYDHSNRASRLLMRIKGALETEGYKFLDVGSPAVPAPSPTSDIRLDVPGEDQHVTCRGAVCTLLGSRVPAGLTKERVQSLSALFRSKQCYKFTIAPRDKSLVRKSGKNTSLPKPVTWPRVEKQGLERETLQDGMDSYKVVGIQAYTFDGKTFFAANAEMCRRWCSGLVRMISRDLDR